MAQKVSVPVSMVSDRKLRFSPPALRTKCRHRFSSKHFTDNLKFSSLRRIFSNHINTSHENNMESSTFFSLLIKCINIVFQNISQTLSNKNIKPDWQVNFEYCQKDYFLRNFQINLDHPLIVGKLHCRFFFPKHKNHTKKHKKIRQERSHKIFLEDWK